MTLAGRVAAMATRLFPALLAALPLAACTTVTMPALKYQPAGVAATRFPGRPAIAVGNVRDQRGGDARTVLQIAGIDTYELARPVAVEVKDALTAELERMGIRTAAPDQRGVLDADVSRFGTTQVTIQVRLLSRDGGRPVWEGTLDGTSSGAGDAGGEARSRVQVSGVPMGGAYRIAGASMWAGISQALSDAVGRLSRQPGFADAVAGLTGTSRVADERRPPAPVAPAPPPRDVTPPTIVINHPSDQARTAEDTVVLAGVVTDDDTVAKVEVLVNGQAIPGLRSIVVTPTAAGRSVPVNVPVPLRPGTNVIVLNATDGSGNTGQAVRTVIREARSAPAVAEPPRFRGQRWAVVIGVSRYQNAHKGIPNLRYADRDARAFYEFLKTPQGGAFTDDHIMFLTDERATYTNVREALFDFLRKPIKEDLVIIFYAGHGVPQPGSPQNLFLLTHDSDPDRLASTAFPMWDLETSLTRFVQAERVLVFTDACHSAGVGSAMATRSAPSENLINRYFQELERSGTGRAIFTASEAGELSQESQRWGGGHGAFTHFLLEAMKGAADANGDGVVTLGEAMDYVSENVRRQTQNAQHPATAGRFDRSIPLAVHR